MAIYRDENGRFLKGSVPNPNGRPTKEYTLSEILLHKLEDKIRIARKLPDGEKKIEEKIAAEALMDVWLDIALTGDSKTIKDIIDRIEGLPKQDIAFTELSLEEKKKRIEVLKNKIDDIR